MQVGTPCCWYTRAAAAARRRLPAALQAFTAPPRGTVQAHEALREAREALYRLQALAELLSKELQRRRGAVRAPPRLAPMLDTASPCLALALDPACSAAALPVPVCRAASLRVPQAATRQQQGTCPPHRAGAQRAQRLGASSCLCRLRLRASSASGGRRQRHAPSAATATRCGTGCPAGWMQQATAGTCGAANAARRRHPASEAEPRSMACCCRVFAL